jgi:hypothetical protein
MPTPPASHALAGTGGLAILGASAPAASVTIAAAGGATAAGDATPSWAALASSTGVAAVAGSALLVVGVDAAGGLVFSGQGSTDGQNFSVIASGGASVSGLWKVVRIQATPGPGPRAVMQLPPYGSSSLPTLPRPGTSGLRPLPAQGGGSLPRLPPPGTKAPLRGP